MASACLIWSGGVEQDSNRLFVRMPQLHISQHFDLDTFLNGSCCPYLHTSVDPSSYVWRTQIMGGEPVVVLVVLPEVPGRPEKRALILE